MVGLSYFPYIICTLDLAIIPRKTKEFHLKWGNVQLSTKCPSLGIIGQEKDEFILAFVHTLLLLWKPN